MRERREGGVGERRQGEKEGGSGREERSCEMGREREFLKTERDVLKNKTLEREIHDGRERGEKRGEERETGRWRERK